VYFFIFKTGRPTEKWIGLENPAEKHLGIFVCNMAVSTALCNWKSKYRDFLCKLSWRFFWYFWSFMRTIGRTDVRREFRRRAWSYVQLTSRNSL